MPTIKVENDVQFFYTDTGLPHTENYTTIIFIHGHTFHAGVFQRLANLATGRSLRVICLNRREYPGTSPYITQELKAIQHGNETERTNVINQQGIYLASFVNKVIEILSLPQSGGVVLSGWSMGNIFSIAVLASISQLPAATKARLQTYVKQVILWDPPSQSLGIPDPVGAYNPLWDEELPSEARGPAFGKWCASYFHHGDLRSRNFSEFNQRNPDAEPKPTVESMTQEELFSVADFVSGSKCETILVEPAFEKILATQTEKALFDQATRKEWGGAKFWHIYGSANSWNIIYSVWCLEKKVGPLDLNFKLMEGANHLFMWEDPARALDFLQECISS
ncbi:Alpha/Beta hydrolase protein [Collybia nuda]|uniref:Alpha/Beta hydrolase protein n=1 Tax=Collybia nuda TaxID=64659 RepID=A0A9P5YCW2_9AGAR|nr:Alpha/Beta hydrolase protein [Collybia nuda]